MRCSTATHPLTFRVYKSTEFCSLSLNSNDGSEMTESGVARPELQKAVFSARFN